MGLFSALLAMVTSYGLCSALGFSFSPLHNFIPFLLLGLGVDDMFVIVQSLDTLPAEDQVTIFKTNSDVIYECSK